MVGAEYRTSCRSPRESPDTEVSQSAEMLRPCQPVQARRLPPPIARESLDADAYKIPGVALVGFEKNFNVCHRKEHIIYHENKTHLKTERKTSRRQLARQSARPPVQSSAQSPEPVQALARSSSESGRTVPLSGPSAFCGSNGNAASLDPHGGTSG